jgi:hypothetical protein
VRRPLTDLLQERKLALRFTLLLCALIYACTLTYPFNNDNALYAYMGELLLHGRLPYIGSWDQNFPAIVVVHSVQILISGHSQLAFHIFDVVLQLCGAYAIILLGERLHSFRTGVLASVLYSLYYVQQGFWMAGERDTYVTILLVWSLILLLKDRPRILIAGVLLGICILFRPTYGLYPIVGVGYILGMGFPVRKAALLALGALVPILLMVLTYLLAGGIEQLYESVILFNLKVYSGAGIAFSFFEPIRAYLISIPAVLLGMFLLWKHSRATSLLVVGMVAASVVSLIVLYRHSVYHYHPGMSLLLVVSSIGWIRMEELLEGSWPRTRWLLPVLVVVFYVAQTFRGNTIQHVLASIVTGRIRTMQESYDAYEPSPEFGVRVQQRVGDYLRARIHPGDRVQMFGPYSYPQYTSGAGTASRFQTLHAITMRGVGDTLQPFQQKWRAEYLADMRSYSPKYFIVCDAPEAFRQYYGGRLGHEILNEDYLELGQWLMQNYTAETKLGAFTVYSRRSQP